MYVDRFFMLTAPAKPHLHPLFTTQRHYKGTKSRGQLISVSEQQRLKVLFWIYVINY